MSRVSSLPLRNISPELAQFFIPRGASTREDKQRVAEHLERAADLILVHGFVRNAWLLEDGPMCAGEALLETSSQPHAERNTGGLETACPVTTWTFAEFLLQRQEKLAARGHLLSGAGHTIIDVNDNTTIDMADAMRLCAKQLREEASAHDTTR